MSNNIFYLVGVDGGGTGTRVAIADCNRVELARANVGPSGLINGADVAWKAILSAVQDACSSVNQPMPALSEIAIGVGLAGVHNKKWANDFAEKNPGFAMLQLATDAYTTLLGAHQGEPGAIVAIGTGSVGEALLADGSRHEIGGWGFPSGDEAGGAWIGLRAVNHCQQVLDGRAKASAFSRAVVEYCTAQYCRGQRDAMFAWLSTATQANYAAIAPLVVGHANQTNPVAEKIMVEAGTEIVKMIEAMDGLTSDITKSPLSIALCGSLANPLKKYLPSTLRKRLVAPRGDSVSGALLLIKKMIENQ